MKEDPNLNRRTIEPPLISREEIGKNIASMNRLGILPGTIWWDAWKVDWRDLATWSYAATSTTNERTISNSHRTSYSCCFVAPGIQQDETLIYDQKLHHNREHHR